MDPMQAKQLFPGRKMQLKAVEGGIQLTYKSRNNPTVLLTGMVGENVLYREQDHQGQWLPDVEEAHPEDLVIVLADEADLD
jgi:hypothetical protein